MSKKCLRISELNSTEDYISFIRQFSSSLIIKKVYEISKEIYFTNLDVNNLFRHISRRDIRSGNNFEKNILIQPWQFVDLIYMSVLYSNDYRGFDDIDYDMFLLVLLQTNTYIETKTKSIIEKIQSPLDVNIFLYGFAGEQFKYQTKSIFYKNLVRELYIIFDLSHKFLGDKNFKSDIKEEIGVSWDNVILVLFGIYLNSFQEQNVSNTINFLSFSEPNDKEIIFNKVVDYYSVDYKTIKNDKDLGRQIFYSKPYIINQKNEIVSGSIFLNQFIVEHAIFWILRNFYMKKSSKENRDFITDFGFLYEKYFEEVCCHFNVNKERIPEAKTERADWKLILGDYIFLIEQKSSIYSLAIKQQLTDFDKYKSEITSKLYKGLSQLENTEKELGLGKTIKIVLCYDEYIDANILPEILSNANSPVKNDGLYFICNTMEIEMLLELSSANKQLFNVVVKDMIRRNSSISNEGVQLLKIMRDNGREINSYWLNPQFSKYKELIKTIYTAFKV